MTDLIPIEEVNGIELFTEEGKLRELLDSIADYAKPIIFDATAEGRKECAALAYKIARSKTAIDSAGKDLVAGWKAKAKVVDGKRKESREFLTDLQSVIRKPVTDWEIEQEQIAQAQADADKMAADEEEAYAEHELWLREDKVLKQQAALDKKQAEQEETDRINQLAGAAKDRARKDAEEAIRQAEVRADNAAADERRKMQAEHDEKERIRLADEEAARIKSENRQHRQLVNRAAMEAFVLYGLEEEVAKTVIRLVATNKIPQLRMDY